MPSKTLPPKPRSIAAKKTISIVASLYNELGYTKASQLTLSELRLLFPENLWSHIDLNIPSN